MLSSVLKPKPLKTAKKLNVGAASVVKKLSYNQQKQQQNQWCWAAFTTSVNLYYNAGSGLTQCTLVNSTFNENSCCVDGTTPQCNQPYTTPDALRAQGNLQQSLQTSISFSKIQQQIYLSKSNPVGCGFNWSGGGGHVVAVYGYAVYDFEGYIEMYVYVKDPWPHTGDSKLLYSNFENAYLGTGRWRRTYLTEA